MDIKKLIKQTLPQNVDYLVGYANMKGLLAPKYNGCDNAIVLCRRLDDRILDNIMAGPNLDYFNLYETVNRELAAVAGNLERAIIAEGSKSLAIPPTFYESRDEDFVKTLRPSFSHKMAATRAGLGWIGKTDLFISRKFGPRIRLATVLTNAPVPYCQKPIDKSKCGSCDLCVRECPAQAARGLLWNIHVDRDEFFDAFACRAKARELSLKNLNREVSLCGKCVAVCPVGKKKKAKNP